MPIGTATHTALTPKAAAAVGDLTTITFYFLLRVGEYKYNSSKKRQRTQQFRVKDVTL